MSPFSPWLRVPSLVLLLFVFWPAPFLEAQEEAEHAAPEAGQAAEASSPEASASEAQAPDPAARFLAFQNAINEIHGVEGVNLLMQLDAFERLGESYPEQDFQEILASFLPWKHSAVGDYAEAHRIGDFLEAPSEPSAETLQSWRDSLKGFKAVDAITAVAAAAADEKALFINEAHHVPQTRVLTWHLLPLLRKAGFTHFAAETLSETGADLEARGFPTLKTGTYLDEPLYADLVRRALDLGFTVVRYESGGRPSKREPGQATNLKERVFDVDPDARLVVHLGYDHNQESQKGFRGVGAMAFHFQKLTGIDPLTLDQTRFLERSRPDVEHRFYAELCGSADAVGALAFVDGDGDFWSLPGDDRDITVCLPRSRYEQGRPTWLGLDGARQAVPVPKDLCRADVDCLVAARLASEGGEAVALDQVVVRVGEDAPALMLSPGRYEVRALYTDGSEGRRAEIGVPVP